MSSFSNRLASSVSRASKFALLFLFAAILFVPSHLFATAHINAGGPGFTDSSGNVWWGDYGYSGGGVFTTNATVAGTSNPTIFRTQRFGGNSSPALRYQYSAANGTYQINLYFAETWSPAFAKGARVFNVALQGNVVFSDLDVYAAVGANTALVKSANITVTNGTITIDFERVVQNPIINGIEIVPLATTQATTSSDVLLGVYYGNQGWDMQSVADMEAWEGKKNAVVQLFTSWCSTQMTNLFVYQLPNIWNNKNVPLITWEPTVCGTTPSNIATLIANGQYDPYISSFAADMKKFIAGPDGVLGTADDRRVYIRFAHEMNGNWYPWSGSPAEYIAMWRRVHGIFESAGLGSSYVQWMWITNVGDVGSYTAEQYYPGDGYVDWVGTDGYNSYVSGIWKTPAQRFDNMIGRLQALTTRPISIAEYGALSTTSTGISVSQKDSWITSMFQYAIGTPGIRMICYYNVDSTTTATNDWSVFGGARGDTTYTISGRSYHVYNAYRSGVQSSNIAPTTGTNLRLLTDPQFAGQ